MKTSKFQQSAYNLATYAYQDERSNFEEIPRELRTHIYDDVLNVLCRARVRDNLLMRDVSPQFTRELERTWKMLFVIQSLHNTRHGTDALEHQEFQPNCLELSQRAGRTRMTPERMCAWLRAAVELLKADPETRGWARMLNRRLGQVILAGQLTGSISVYNSKHSLNLWTSMWKKLVASLKTADHLTEG